MAQSRQKKVTWKQLAFEQQMMLAKIYSDKTLTPEAVRAKLAAEKEKLHLSLSLQTLEREIRHLLYYQRQLLGTKAATAVDLIPKSPKRKYIDFHVVQSDNCLIVSDIEVPDHNQHMLRIALLDAMAHGVKDVIWNGDLVATDQDALNTWINDWKAGDETSFDEDKNTLRRIVGSYAEWFERQWATEGNHDARIAKKTGGEVHVGWMLEGLDIEYSRFPYMYVETSTRGIIKVLHPGNFSGNPVTLAQKFYNTERGPYFPERPTKTHIVIGHCHRAQSGWSEDGLYEMHATGMMRDDMRTAYKMRSPKKYAQWDAGYLIMIDGYLYNRTLRGTDWKAVLGDLYELSPFVTDPDEVQVNYLPIASI